MTFADFASRLRLFPDGNTCSQIPKNKPLGCLELYSIDTLQSQEIITTGQHDGIIDHGWTDDGTLLVLTKQNPGKTGGVFSMLRIFQKNNNQSGWSQLHTTEYRYLASHVLSKRDIVVVGHGSGVWVYRLSHLLVNDGSTVHAIELIRCNGVHAMYITDTYLAVVSGVKLGVWNIDNMDENRPVAIWCTTLSNGLERATCVVISKSGRIIAVASWDGSVRVYQQLPEEIGPHWRPCQVGANQRPWESCAKNKEIIGRFPTFAALYESAVDGKAKELLAVSIPGFSGIRFFDLVLCEELLDKTRAEVTHDWDFQETKVKKGGFTIHGLVSPACWTVTDHTGNAALKMLWTDETDVLHGCDWPL